MIFFRFNSLPLLLVLVGMFFVSRARAAPLGPAFRVNTSTPGEQRALDVTAGANGDVLVFWKDVNRGNQTCFQRYAADGRALGNEVSLGSDITQDGQFPWGGRRTAMDRAGNFVVTRTAPDGSKIGVFATVYDRDGRVRVPEFRVNDVTAGRQDKPGAVMNESGEFAIVWTSNEDYPEAVKLKRYRANGAALTGEVTVTRRDVNQTGPKLAMDRLGNFVVTWQDRLGVDFIWSRWFQRFNSAGVAQGAAVRIGTEQENGAAYVAMDPFGNFVVVWRAPGAGGVSNTFEIYAQRYNAAGSAVGGRLRVNASTINEGNVLGSPAMSVAMNDLGSFVVVRESFFSRRIYARHFRSDGSAVEPAEVELAVGSGPEVAMDAFGNYTVTWMQTGDHWDVFARRFLVDTLPPVSTLVPGQMRGGLAGATGSFTFYRVTVPSGMTTLDVSIQGASGDADLYVRYAALPGLELWDARPYFVGSTERAIINNVPAGDWFIGVHGYAGYSDLALTASYR